MMKLKSILQAVLASTVFSAAAFAVPIPTYFLVTSDITGAQTQIDTNHSSIWTFAPSVEFYLGGGNFVMKDGGQFATYDIGLSLFSGAVGTGTSIADVTLTNTQFSAQTANDQAFQQHPFLFSPILLSVGQTYTLVLHSDAPDAQSKAYFIKGEDKAYFGTPGSPVDVTNPITNTVGDPVQASVPEPSTYLLTSSAFLLFGGIRAIRRRRSRA